MQFLYFLLIGLIAGFLAGLILHRRGYGLLGNLIIGVLGALAGGFLFKFLGLAATNTLGSIISATVGAIVVLLIVGAIKKHA